MYLVDGWGKIINEIDMYFYYFNMFDVSIENIKKNIIIVCYIVKIEKIILYGCFVRIVFDMNNIVI